MFIYFPPPKLIATALLMISIILPFLDSCSQSHITLLVTLLFVCTIIFTVELDR